MEVLQQIFGFAFIFGESHTTFAARVGTLSAQKTKSSSRAFLLQQRRKSTGIIDRYFAHYFICNRTRINADAKQAHILRLKMVADRRKI